MEDARLDARYTVVVRGPRIVAVGPSSSTPVPPDALVIDGDGRYALPGLVDSHVHITTDMPWAPARADFGDAPLYLAHGVTTVVNLHGGPAQLEWRRRVQSGDLPGPTIYTSGPFINEPEFSTAAAIRAEVARQQHDGYDLIKFHEREGTTRGLSEPAYMALVDAAREHGMPLVGHAPVNLGFEVLRRSRQPLAHTGAISMIAFRPVQRHIGVVMASLASLAGLIVLGVISVFRRRAFSPWMLPLVLLSAVGVFFTLPGAPFFDSQGLRIAVTILTLCVAVVSIRAVVMRAWANAVLLVVFATTLAAFWLPMVWRGSRQGIERIAAAVAEADIPVQSTLIVYESMSSPERARLIDDPAIAYLHPAARAQWRALSRTGPPGFRFHTFMKQVVGALDAAGATVMAGTDAMGMPLITPGVSLLRELELLVESGLTPHEALRAATVTPARFLHKETEFGRIAAGHRADVLMVSQNPLDDISHLRAPIGVMVRGEWWPRDRLDQMLASLTIKD